MARRSSYYFRETISGIQRNGLITFAAIATVFISLFLFGGAQLIGRQIGLAVDAQTEKVEIAVYLNDDISQADLDALRNQLNHMPEVANLRYESKDEAYHRFLTLFANQPDLINNTRKDALPASFRVKLVNPDTQIDSIRAQVGNAPGVESVQDQRDLLNKLFAISNVLKTGAYVASIVMLIAAIALIGNTVRMAVFARRKEIGIMRLVGATNWFIRVPFLVEGIVAGLIGAGLAIGFLFILQHVFFASIHQTILFLPLVASADVYRLVPWILGAGVLVAFLASYMAMRRFLEV
ncbi:MAG TPA: permease-like cell division protein FtsX [Actinomycetota bacterium]|nr:permease-like cell division protein FtsX [Actinomycetota bacterium]